MIDGHAYFDLVRQSERTQSMAAQAPLMALHGSAEDRRGLALMISEETQRLVSLLNSAEAQSATEALGPRGNLDPPSHQVGEDDEEHDPRAGV